MNVDIFLYVMPEPLIGINDVIVANPTRPRPAHHGITAYVGTTIDRRRKKKEEPLFGLGPVVAQTLHDNLVERYGEITGKFIYYRMELEQKGPFQPGAKYGRKK